MARLAANYAYATARSCGKIDFQEGSTMNIQIFGTSKCFDTKKAQRYFKERGVKFQMIDLKEKEMSRGEFDNVARALGAHPQTICLSRCHSTGICCYPTRSVLSASAAYHRNRSPLMILHKACRNPVPVPLPFPASMHRRLIHSAHGPTCSASIPIFGTACPSALCHRHTRMQEYLQATYPHRCGIFLPEFLHSTRL